MEGSLAEAAGLGSSPADETFEPRAELEGARMVWVPREHPREHQTGSLIVAPFAQQHQRVAVHRMDIACIALQDMLETSCSSVGIAPHQVQDVAQIQGRSQVQLVVVQAPPQFSLHLVRIPGREIGASALPAHVKAPLCRAPSGTPVAGASAACASHPQSVLASVARHRRLHGNDRGDQEQSQAGRALYHLRAQLFCDATVTAAPDAGDDVASKSNPACYFGFPRALVLFSVY